MSTAACLDDSECPVALRQSPDAFAENGSAAPTSCVVSNWLRRCSCQAGASSSMAMVLLTPVMVVLMFLAWQAALWNHAKSHARIVAQQTAVLVARSGVSAAAAQQSASASLTADGELQHISVSVTSAGGIVTVAIHADASGVVRGTSSAISVRAVVAVEDWASA